MGVVCYGTVKSIEMGVVCINQGSQGMGKIGGSWKLQESPGGTMVAARCRIRMQIGGFECCVWSGNQIGS